MKCFQLFFYGVSLLAISCAESSGEDEPTSKPQQPQTPKSPSGAQTTSSASPAPSTPPTPLTSAAFQQFKADLNSRFPGYKSLPPEVLFQIIDVVPSQSTTWGCGLVQTNMAWAAASISLGLPIERQKVADCNTVGNYPLLLDEEMDQQKKEKLENLVGNFVQGVKIELEEVNGVNRFRVGADPRMLPAYLDSKLPSKMKAILVEKRLLSKNELIARIDKNLQVGMPLITLYLISALKFQIHYYSIVGYNAHRDKLLILNTQGAGIERLKEFDTDQFINEMNMEQFRNLVVAFRRVAPLMEVKLGFKLPDMSKIDTLANYNLIQFNKTP